MYKSFVTLFLVFNYALAQNLVPNESFEEYTICPYSQIFWPVEDWYRVVNHNGTADNLNVCATDPIYTVPDNLLGSQIPDDGDGYSGIYCFNPQNEVREYLQVQLTNPLIGGQLYEVSFKISLADNSTYAVNKIGVAITQTPIEGNGNLEHIPVSPQVFSSEIISDKVNWTEISGIFQATGGELYLTVGNFFSDQEITIDVVQSGQPFCYYYIDSFNLIGKTLSIDVPEFQLIKIFPNPTEDQINIIIPFKYESKRIQIFSLTGLVKEYEGNLKKINLRELSGGVYFMRITTTNNISEVFQIIKQ